MLDEILNWVTVLLVTAAGLLSLFGGIGIMRFPDPISRLHAATKPQMFGLILLVFAVALMDRSWMTLFAMLPVLVLKALAAPVAAHAIGRATYRVDGINKSELAVDELAPVIAEAEELTEQWPKRVERRRNS